MFCVIVYWDGWEVDVYILDWVVVVCCDVFWFFLIFWFVRCALCFCCCFVRCDMFLLERCAFGVSCYILCFRDVWGFVSVSCWHILVLCLWLVVFFFIEWFLWSMKFRLALLVVYEFVLSVSCVGVYYLVLVF
jgi:hypothetical protein